MTNKPLPRILVVAPSWIGDTVFAQPLFELLHRYHPGLTLEVLAAPYLRPVLEHMPRVQSIIDSPFAHGELRFGERRRLAVTLRNREYDQAIVLPNSLKSALAPFLAKIPLRTGYLGEMRFGLLNDARRLDAKLAPTMVDRYAFLAAPRGKSLSRPIPRPVLQVVSADLDAVLKKFGLETNRPVAIFCPGAEYGPARRWPAEHYGTLAKSFIADGKQVWLLGSSKDREIADAVQLASGGICRNLAGETHLREAIRLLAAASCVVSNDTGLLHVASALNRPVVALYGSTAPGLAPPYSDRSLSISLNLPCSPCRERICPLGHFNCMNQLTPERVAQTITSL
jgi:heptosyltransferase II